MGSEIDLLVNYPKAKRNVLERGQNKTEEDRRIARQFGKEFFDGDRRHGYGGYNYHPRFWGPVIPTFKAMYGLSDHSSILDIGCGKGFMLYDFQQAIPGISLRGIDISSYAIEHAHEAVTSFVSVGDARKISFADNSFDLVISINTIHNLVLEDLKQSLKEIQRVSRGNSFIMVDAFRDDREKELMYAWNLTAKTILHVDEWENLFEEVGYTGDYFWFVP